MSEKISYFHQKYLAKSVMLLLVFLTLSYIVYFAISSLSAKSSQTSCLSNMRKMYQIVQAMHQDSHGSWPSLVEWEPMTQGKFRCSSAPMPAETDKRYTGYAINNLLSGSRGIKGDVPYPGVTVIVSEQPLGVESASSCVKNTQPGYEYMETPCTRHQGKGNFLFADGHVRILAPEQVEGEVTEFDKATGNRYSFLVR
jgi:prepilin-type processing-associated H-X9-DG protein